jgi:hypothetical protein
MRILTGWFFKVDCNLVIIREAIVEICLYFKGELSYIKMLALYTIRADYWIENLPNVWV